MTGLMCCLYFESLKDNLKLLKLIYFLTYALRISQTINKFFKSSIKFKLSKIRMNLNWFQKNIKDSLNITSKITVKNESSTFYEK